MKERIRIFFNFKRISDIEKEIFLTKQEIFELPQKLKSPHLSQAQLDGLVNKEKEPLLYKLDLLKIEREFLLSKREAWLPKTIWNLIVPIIVSLIVALVVTKLNLK